MKQWGTFVNCKMNRSLLSVYTCLFMHHIVLVIQFHGGTNFGRTASAYVITSYYDQAPLDEYGMVNIPLFLLCNIFSQMWYWFTIFFMNPGLIRQPKWGHLKELHAAIKSCSTTILEGVQSNFSLGQLQQVISNTTQSYVL